MQVIGLCRFSYPALGGFQVEHESIEDRMAYLWADERMEERFRSFEHFTVASLKAQTDPNFTLIVLIGEDMPAHHVARLEDIIADVPQIIIEKRAPGPHRAVMQEVINSVRIFKKAPALEFRLDDDDALGVHFIKRLREVALQAKPLLTNGTLAIDFNRGFIIEPSPQGLLGKEIQQSYWTSALAMMVAPKSKHTIMNFAHSRIWRHMPTVTLPDKDMLLRGHNAHNDSRQNAEIRPIALPLLGSTEEKRLETSYGISADDVRESYKAPAHVRAHGARPKTRVSTPETPPKKRGFPWLR